jgi:hypothetical protein
VALEEVADHREVRLGFALEDRQVARLAEDGELAAGDALGERAAAAIGRQLARADALWRTALESYEPPPIDEGIREELNEYAARRRRELGD